MRRGGTINEDDHVFGLSACKKYGGIHLPPHMGVIHQYMREAVTGDGSAREQAASCRQVLLGSANITREYATKRYRSDCINWGMVPFVTRDADAFGDDDYIFAPTYARPWMGT